MDEYKMQEVARWMATYYQHEPEPDYTAEGLLAALRWATEAAGVEEAVAGWSVADILDRARDEFDLRLTTAQARTVLAMVEQEDANWDAVDHCIQQWKDRR